jgi:hypothetical protein
MRHFSELVDQFLKLAVDTNFRAATPGQMKGAWTGRQAGAAAPGVSMPRATTVGHTTASPGPTVSPPTP